MQASRRRGLGKGTAFESLAPVVLSKSSRCSLIGDVNAVDTAIDVVVAVPVVDVIAANIITIVVIIAIIIGITTIVVSHLVVRAPPKSAPPLIGKSGGGLFLFHVCRGLFRGDVQRGGQRAVRADGTRPIKSQRFLFHQRQR